MLACQIKVYTKQQYDTHQDCQDKIFKGKLYRKNENIFIIYEEKDSDTGYTITNHLKVTKDGSVSIRRMGDAWSTLCFREGTPYRTFYNTGQGTIELIFQPAVVTYKETQLDCEIELRYAVYAGESKLSNNVYILKATFLA